jgi:PAS domain S-box-containing protein
MDAHLTTMIDNEHAELRELHLCIVESAPLPMALLGGVGQILRYANQAFCGLLDLTKEELVGRALCEVVPKNDKCVALIDRVLCTGKPVSHTEEEHWKTHPLFWSYTIWPVASDKEPKEVMIQVTETAQLREKTLAMNEALILGSLRQHELTEIADASNALLQIEIGERKQAEDSLREAQALLTERAGLLDGLVAERTAELTATNRQLEAFVYSIAHDLRAPLRAMQGYSGVLVEEAKETLDEASQEYARRINRSAQFMDAMLIDLLAFSRISQQAVELTSVSLGSSVDSMLLGLEREIQEKNASVDSSSSWPSVMAHESTLAQVLSNLVGNALKFVRIDVPIAIRLHAEEKGPFTRIWVDDNGIGIKADHQEQIFRLFSRLDGEKYGGTGVGLAIVQKGVERMGGRVGVQSGAEEGSHFWFELLTASPSL